ncbi:MAG TPA: aconitate hydratase AcnA [Chlorobaculum sp.]|nr:aconitate hydratase AcnA [Chlorobaculum sp.]
MNKPPDPYGVCLPLSLNKREVFCYSLRALEKQWPGLAAYPKTIKVLLEAALRNFDDFTIRTTDIEAIANWGSPEKPQVEVPFKPVRVVLQDFTGVPAIVDLAALREACAALGGDASRINPLVTCDLVIDHSVQVDYFGSPDAFGKNLDREFERNLERYQFLKWGEKAFRNFHVVPPGTGIVHQVNLEYLSDVVHLENGVAYPDSLVGTDSHTTMINALGVLGWGVGGIEAEAVMLGQPVYMLLPDVVGVRLSGALGEGVCATDLVLTLTSILRREGVVGSFVEFFGPGLSSLSLPDRATVANMAPEYGATTGFFPVDEETLAYLALSGREERCEIVESYCRQQGLWHEVADTPAFSRVIGLDMSTVRPSLAGPKRPQDRIDLSAMGSQWERDLSTVFARPFVPEADQMAAEGGVVSHPDPGRDGIEITMHGRQASLRHGAVVIAAITSCTNTSNPEILITAALMARAARQRGLLPQPWVKTSFAPGSRVVIDYLASAGFMDDLEALGFSNVAFGCTTCIGNSGPLPEPVAEAIRKGDLIVASVLSGNRNFEGRINPLVKANYLASPALVIAYALAGNVAIDFEREPLGIDGDGSEVFLRDLFPSDEEVREVARSVVLPDYFRKRYAEVHQGPERWQAIEPVGDEFYRWDPASSYIRKPPFFDDIGPEPMGAAPIRHARCLALFGDSVTTDHISPAGTILPGQPAGAYLLSTGVSERDFNTFGSRRGNHEVMVRGTFDNIRLRNKLAPGTEGGYTTWFRSDRDGDGEEGSIYDSAMLYQKAGVPLIVIAGKDYGMGSSRDWAAKGTAMLGVRAVIAVSFERIHRSNLIGMGVLPLQFPKGLDAASLGLSGRELFDIVLNDALKPGDLIDVVATDPKTGKRILFTVLCRIDTPVEVEYFRNGGILQTVVRRIAAEGR